MSSLSPDLFYRRNLPHIQPPAATFFVTFRLTGSIPMAVLADLQNEARKRQIALERETDPQEHAKRIYEAQRWFFGRWDAALDADAGPDWLRNPAVAEIVSKAMHHFDGDRYELLAYCIMSNHVHVVFTPLLKTTETYYPLAQIMHSMKGYPARRANEVLGRSGAFWQHESYDHYVRSVEELERIIAYVLSNPVNAGLVSSWRDWPWTHVVERFAARFEGL